MQEMKVQSLSLEDPLEQEMATHSSILNWEIPWTEEPGGLQSTGSQRVRHDLVIEQQDAKLLQSCLTLCDPMDHSLPGSSVHGILQARILESGCHALLQGIFLAQGSNPLLSPALTGGFFTTSTTWEAFNSDPHWNSPNQHSPAVYRYLQLDGAR